VTFRGAKGDESAARYPLISKCAPDDLALFGGEAVFDQPLHVGRPNVGDRRRLHERIDDMLDRRWLTNDGPFVRAFEAKVAEVAGARHCVAVCNGTLALEIAIRALGLTGEVIVPSFTFVATAHALEWQGIRPVFCDVDPSTHNLDPRSVEERITPRTTGIIGVHLWGRPCDVEGLQALADARGLALAFDAAHALGCSRKGRMVGCFGRAEVFSFHATKFVNAGEGGAVATNDADLAARIRSVRNFGFGGYDRVVELGTNGKMSELAAAMGLTSLESFDQFVEQNRRNHERYRETLADIAGLSLAAYDESERPNFQYVVVEVAASEAGLSRDQLVELLWAENILARRYFFPGCHRMQPYRTREPATVLPVTEALASRVLLLPTGSEVGPDEVAGIGGVLRCAVAHAPEVRRRMAGRPWQYVTDVD
jgi:dTDP-4-amino-4,6-dideoxygalactose transaminase